MKLNYSVQKSIEKSFNKTIVKLNGNITEGCNDQLFKLQSELMQSEIVEIDCRGLGHINSTGIPHWISFISTINGTLFFSHCPINFVEYGMMIRSFFGRGSLESLLVPYYCDHCDNEENILVPISELDTFEAPTCSKHNAKMTTNIETDDIKHIKTTAFAK